MPVKSRYVYRTTGGASQTTTPSAGAASTAWSRWKASGGPGKGRNLELADKHVCGMRDADRNFVRAPGLLATRKNGTL